jgi:hypothetical protein
MNNKEEGNMTEKGEKKKRRVVNNVMLEQISAAAAAAAHQQNFGGGGGGNFLQNTNSLMMDNSVSSSFPAAGTNKLPPGPRLMNTGAVEAEGVTKKRTRLDQAIDDAEAAVVKAISTDDALKIAVATVALKLVMAEEAEAKIGAANAELERAEVAKGDITIAERKVQRAKLNHAEAKVVLAEAKMVWAEARRDALITAERTGSAPEEKLLTGLRGSTFNEWITAAEAELVRLTQEKNTLLKLQIPMQIQGAGSASSDAPRMFRDSKKVADEILSTVNWPTAIELPFYIARKGYIQPKKNIPINPYDEERFPEFLLYGLGEIYYNHDELLNYLNRGTAMSCILAPSGAGKTRAILEVLCKHYGCLLQHRTGNPKNYGSFALTTIVDALKKDDSLKWSLEEAVWNKEFAGLRMDLRSLKGEDLSKFKNTIKSKSPGIYEKRRRQAEFGMKCVVSSYLLLLSKFLEKIPQHERNKDKTKLQWLYLQLFPEHFFESDPFSKLAMALFTQCNDDGRELAEGLGKGFTVFIDEAQMLGRTFIHQFSSHLEASDALRPVLSPFLKSVHDVLSSHAIICGTGLTLLEEQESVGSVFAENDVRHIFATFPPLAVIEVRKFIDEILPETDKAILSKVTSWLEGRPRLSTLFLKTFLTQNESMEKCLVDYIKFMTMSSNTYDSNNLRSPGQSIAELVKRSYILIDGTPNPLTAFLRNAFFISLGYSPQPAAFAEYLALGLGGVDSDRTRAASFLNFQLIVHVLPEPLLLEAARQYIISNNIHFSFELLASTQRDSSALGKSWEFVVLMGFGEYLPNLRDKINGDKLVPDAFKKEWNLFEPNFGRIGHPNGVGSEGFFVWQEWCFQHMHFKKGSNTGNAAISAMTSTISTSTPRISSTLADTSLKSEGHWKIVDFGNKVRSRASRGDKKQAKEENRKEQDEQSIMNILWDLPPLPLCLTSNIAGPDLCFVLNADDVKSIMFVFIQVKLSKEFDLKDAQYTVDPSLFYFSNRGKEEEKWTKKYGDYLIRWMINLMLDDVPVIRMIVSGADSENKLKEQVTEIVNINREDSLRKLFLFKYHDERIPLEFGDAMGLTKDRLVELMGLYKIPSSGLKTKSELAKALLLKLSAKTANQIEQEASTWMSASKSSTSKNKPAKKEQTELLKGNEETELLNEEIDKMFKGMVETDFRWNSYSEKKATGKLIGKDILIYLNDTGLLIGEALANMTKIIKNTN